MMLVLICELSKKNPKSMNMNFGFFVNEDCANCLTPG